ncbi:MAG: hypothetical protein GY947_06230 [Rhodobacteraceae bacterium]|nr:hypothetical protein [Paracoccaceae bacterium]
MTVQPLQLADTNLVAPVKNIFQDDTAELRIKRLTRESTAVTEALSRTPLRFSLVKSEGRRLHLM